MANGIRTGDPCGFNKGRSSKFREGSRVRQTPEGRRTYRPKRCGNNNKDEDNSHVASIIKKEPHRRFSLLVPLPTTVSIRSIVAALDGIRILVPSTTRDPRATNARAELKGTGHTQLSSNRHFICKPYQTTSP